jgi:hypothetical protein
VPVRLHQCKITFSLDILFDFTHLFAVMVEHTDNAINTGLIYVFDTYMREMCSVMDIFLSLSGANSSAIILEILLLTLCIFEY